MEVSASHIAEAAGVPSTSSVSGSPVLQVPGMWWQDAMGNKLSCSCAPLIRKAYRYEDSPWQTSRRRDGHLLRWGVQHIIKYASNQEIKHSLVQHHGVGSSARAIPCAMTGLIYSDLIQGVDLWKPSGFSSVQEVLCILWNTKFNYRDHRSPTLPPSLRQINLKHSIYFFQICLILSFSLRLGLPSVYDLSFNEYNFWKSGIIPILSCLRTGGCLISDIFQ